MPRISYPGFLGPAYQSQSPMADSEILRNWYLEKNESAGAPTAYVALPCPGYQTFADGYFSPIRGLFAQHGVGINTLEGETQQVWFVGGGFFYELVDAGGGVGGAQNYGSVGLDDNPVTISSNGNAGERRQLWVTSAGKGYCIDIEDQSVTEAGVPGTTVTMGAYLDARFMYLDATTGSLYVSDLYNCDNTSWDATMVAQSESGSPWLALAVTPDGLIHLMGDTQSETWTNQGTSPFPFSQVREGSIPFGIAAPYAFSVDTNLTWLAQNSQGTGFVMRMSGYTPTRISTHAIEQAIHDYGDLSQTTAYAYIETGHTFTVFNFPAAGHTWAVDGATSLWHERGYWNTATGLWECSRPSCLTEAWGLTLVGDRNAGTIYVQSSSISTDVDGSLIRRQRQPPRLSLNQKRFTVDRIQLVMDVGLGVSSGQGSDPQVLLSVSKDGGRTYGPERSASAGALGAYGTRVQWTRCGQARNLSPLITVTDPIPWRLVDCLVDVREGTS